MATKITITSTINRDLQTVWELWTTPKHIKNWNTASTDWHTVHAENDLRKAGKFSSRMEAKDGSMGFDFGGTYTEIITNKHIAYTLDDGRTVTISFENTNNTVLITETFEPETQSPAPKQKEGWQAILDHFKHYAESF